MKKKIIKYFKEITLFFLMMIVFANILSLYRSNELNKEALNISNATLLNNNLYTIPKDKALLVHFWATWCPICKAEAPNIQTISEKYSVLTIAYKSGDDEEIKEYLKKYNLSFNVANDYNGSITKNFGVSIFPTTIIYDKKGDVIYSDVGYTSTLGLWFRMWWASL